MKTASQTTKSYISFFVWGTTGGTTRAHNAGEKIRALRTKQGTMLEPGETSVSLVRNNRPLCRI